MNGDGEICFDIWRAVRGSARVLAQTGDELWARKIYCRRVFCLGEPGAGAPGPLAQTGNSA